MYFFMWGFWLSPDVSRISITRRLLTEQVFFFPFLCAGIDDRLIDVFILQFFFVFRDLLVDKVLKSNVFSLVIA